MNKNQRQKVWVYTPKAPKFTAKDKAVILSKVKELIIKMPKLSKKVSKIDMRANRIYMHELVEQFMPEGTVLIKPLIDGKYLEYPYARITFNDTQGNNCTADYQRHTGQWMTMHTGSLEECINNVEEDNFWF